MSVFRSIILGLLLAIPMVSGASTLAFITNPDGSLSAHLAASNAAAFSNVWDFTVPNNGGITTANINTKGFGQIQGFSGDLDGTPLVLDNSSPFFQVLSLSIGPSSAGPHVLTISGTSGGSYGGDVVVAPVPVPAALWLMGSALVGLVSFGRRKTALPAA